MIEAKGDFELDPSGGHFRPQQWWRDTYATLLAERDRARDLAAHALAIEPLDDETDFAAGYNEARSDFRAVLAAHLEAELAEETQQ